MCELTGPMIVACQWNTENDRKQHNYKLVHTSSPTCLIRLDASWFNDGTGLKTDWWSSQSSPTGPAEHWAGGSLWRSVSSCGERKKKKLRTQTSPAAQSEHSGLSRTFMNGSSGYSTCSRQQLQHSVPKSGAKIETERVEEYARLKINTMNKWSSELFTLIW